MTMLCAAAFATFASADPVAPDPAAAPVTSPGQDAKPKGEGHGSLSEEELRDLVSTIMMVRVSRSLELTDEQTVVLVKHMQEMRDEVFKLYKQRDESAKALRDLVAKDGAADGDIDAKLKDLISVDEKRAQVKKDAFDKISAGMSVKQKAKLYITLQDFEGQMRKMMSRAKEMGEDVLREKMQSWERGEGPPMGGLMDRPNMRQMMKNRRGGPSADDEAPKAPQAPETKAP